jgi:hypothetical protein
MMMVVATTLSVAEDTAKKLLMEQVPTVNNSNVVAIPSNFR